MDSVGARLREAREARGMSLEDVAQITKISKSALDAIENDQFHGFPAPIFVRGFIRSFAKTVDLDPHEIVRLLPQEFAHNPAPTTPETPHSPVTGADIRRGSGGALQRSSQLLLVLLAVGMFFAAWLLMGNKNEPNEHQAQPSDPPALQQRVDGVSSFSDARVP